MTDNDVEPSKAELIERVEQLESEQQTLKSQLKRMLPSRRDALKAGAAGAVGIGALGVASDSAESATGSAGTIGSSSDRPDIFADEIDANSLTGSATTDGFKSKTRAFVSPGSTSTSTVELSNISFDPDNNFSTSTFEYTVPATGTYQIHAQARSDNSHTGQFSIRVQRNGSTVMTAENFAEGNFPTTHTSGLLELSSGDTVELINRFQSPLIGDRQNTYLTILRLS
jgi:hypothetical protein